MARMLADHPGLTAVVAMHNTTAVGAINAIQGAGRSVPTTTPSSASRSG